MTADQAPGEFTIYINNLEPISVLAAHNNFDAPARINLKIQLEAKKILYELSLCHQK